MVYLFYGHVVKNSLDDVDHQVHSRLNTLLCVMIFKYAVFEAMILRVTYISIRRTDQLAPVSANDTTLKHLPQETNAEWKNIM